MGVWCQNDVVSTSMRRNYVASPLRRRHFHVICPLGANTVVRPKRQVYDSCLFSCLTNESGSLNTNTPYNLRHQNAMYAATQFRMADCSKFDSKSCSFQSLQKASRSTKSVSNRAFLLHKSKLPIFFTILQSL